MLRAVVALLVLLVPAMAQAEARFALLIGNQSYSTEIGRLANPHNDVAILEAALKGLGFDVAVERDVSLGAMTRALNAYARRAQAAGPNAIGFFYYSGHGVSDGGTNYLIPIDVKTTETGELWDRSLRLTDVTRKLKAEAGNATHFVVFDACRNNLKLTQPGSRAIVSPKGFVPIAQESGMLIAYATAEGELASDVGAGGGPYAKVLAEEVIKPGIEAVVMFRVVQRRVRTATAQEPYLGFNAIGDVYLAGKPDAGAAPPAAQPPFRVFLSEAAEAWDRVKDTTSAAALEEFIRRFGHTYYGVLAKARMDQIKGGRAADIAPPREQPDLATTDCERTRAADIAIRACSDIISRFPTFAMAYANRANGYRHAGDRERALSDLGKALELDPQNTNALARRILTFKDMGEDAKAQADFERLIGINPTRSIDFDAIGLAYGSKRDYDRAISNYNKAIELDPKYAVAYGNRGSAYNNKGEHDRAISDFNKAIELDPKYAVAYSNRGYAYAGMREYDRAISDYNKAIELDPKYAVAYNHRGYAHARKGDYDRAISDYSKAIELSSRFALAYSHRGYAYANKSEYDRAISDLNKAIELDPKIAEAYSHRGYANARRGDYDRAISDYNKAIELSPKFAVAYSHRGYAYASKSEYDRAISDYNKAIEFSPKFAEAYSHRGYAHASSGDYDRAISDYNKAIELSPKLAGAYSNRGYAYVYKRDKNHAIADFRKALSLDPNLNGAREGLRRFGLTN